jgi:integrase
MARDVRDWKAYQQTTEKVAPFTVNQRLAAVSCFFKWALQKELSQSDPTSDVRTLRLPLRQPKWLDSREVRRLLRAINHHPNNFAKLVVLIGTFIRVGELLGKSIGDVEIGEYSGKPTVLHSEQVDIV